MKHYIIIAQASLDPVVIVVMIVGLVFFAGIMGIQILLSQTKPSGYTTRAKIISKECENAHSEIVFSGSHHSEFSVPEIPVKVELPAKYYLTVELPNSTFSKRIEVQEDIYKMYQENAEIKVRYAESNWSDDINISLV